MYNAVEFDRVPRKEPWGDKMIEGPVFIVPAMVLIVEPIEGAQGSDSVITLVEGIVEIVKGPPSEVNRRLRSGQ